MQLQVGQVQKYKIQSDEGDFYKVRNLRNQEFNLYKRYCSKKYVRNQFIELHSFSEKDHQVFLSPRIPILKEGDVGRLKVIDQNPHGIFLDNGTERDLLIPNSEKDGYVTVGDYVLVKVIRGENGLIKATMNVETRSSRKSTEIKNGQRLKGRVVEHLQEQNRKDLKGIRYLTDDGLYIFVHKSEMEYIPKLNEEVEGRVIFIREDNKINASFLPHVKERPNLYKEQIVRKLHQEHGVSPVTDKSSAEEIKLIFGLSKKAFKKAISVLIKEDRVELKNNKLYLK
ncbi:MAG: hypothetical protein KDD94_05900 [Calditrichaeota bacterium]|nr:hypothetical protein [Calditrichota bacterium]